MKKILNEYRGLFLQFIKFGLVGASNVAISLLCFYILIHVFNIHYLLANVISFLCGFLNSYLWNKYWVFRQDATNKNSGIRFFVVNAANFGVNSLLLILLVEKLRFSPMTAQPLIIFITTFFGFFLTKVWVFKKKKE